MHMLSFFSHFSLFIDECYHLTAACVMYLQASIHHHALHVQAEEEELKVGMSSNLKPIMQTSLENDRLTL